MTVSKFRAARELKRAENGKCEDRKSYQESGPAVVTLANKLHRKPRSGKRKPLRSIAPNLLPKIISTVEVKLIVHLKSRRCFNRNR